MTTVHEGVVCDRDDTPPSTAIAEYSQTAAALATLHDRYAGKTFDVSTKTGMEEAKAARAELRGYRTALERKRVEIKAPALERCNLIDSEAKALKEALEAIEDPIADQIKAEEERVAAERARAEQERIAREEAQNAKIEGFRNAPLSVIGARSDAIAATLAQLEAENLEDFDEAVLATALTSRDTAIAQLRGLLSSAKATEEAAAALAAQREELARQQEAAAAREAAARAEREEAERVARKAREAQERAEREERERIDRERTEAAQAELAQLRAEAEAREKAEAERRAAEHERSRVLGMLRGYPDRHAKSGPETLEAAHAELTAYVIPADLFADPEQLALAEDAREMSLSRVRTLLTTRLREADEKLAAEQAERARIEAESAAAKEAAAAIAEAERLHVETVDLDRAIREAVTLLTELGFGDRIQTRALAAAHARCFTAPATPEGT